MTTGVRYVVEHPGDTSAEPLYLMCPDGAKPRWTVLKSEREEFEAWGAALAAILAYCAGNNHPDWFDAERARVVEVRG